MHPILSAIAFVLCLVLPTMASAAAPSPVATDVPVPGLEGRLLRHADFASRHIAARNVDVWLPPGYGHGDTRYPVLYMHDGQNLFGASPSPGGTDWGIDEAITRLSAAGEIRPPIVVAVWNTPDRLAEYMPRAPLDDAPVEFLAGHPTMDPSQIMSDAYIDFLAAELKPFIDREYRTLPEPGTTSIMGSSMGGLVSLYALARYPQVFGAAAAVSTHWPAGNGITIAWLAHALPPAGQHRLYFDFGTRTLDAAYEPFQQRMDKGIEALGYRQGHDWLTLKFEGHEHSEVSWRARVDRPLRFLLAAPTGD